MLNRCNNAKNKSFKNYGGRGITVAEDWHNFATFYRDMGAAPFEGASIERRDTDIGYNKDNCYWATYTEQNNNRRDNRRFTFNDSTRTIGQWAAATGIDYHTLYNRLTKHGWPIEKALTTPVNGKMPNPIDNTNPGMEN